MTEIAEVRTAFAGEAELGAANKLHFIRQDSGAFTEAHIDVVVAAVRTFWDNISDALPTEISVQVDPLVRIMEHTTGTLVRDATATTAGAPVVGSGTGDAIAGVGLRIILQTARILRGRHVRGAMAIVPSAKNVFSAAGFPSVDAATVCVNAVNTLRGAVSADGTDLIVYSRPLASAPASGETSAATGARLSPFASVLRARR